MLQSIYLFKCGDKMQYRYDYFGAEDIELPDNAWDSFRDCAPASNLRRDSLLYIQGDGARCFYYIVSGEIKTFISSENGEERILTVYRTGDILGEAAFFDGLPRVSSAIALTDCRIVAIDDTLLEKCFASTPGLALSMMKYLARTIRMLSSHVDSLSFLSARSRIASHILRLCGGENGRIKCTQDEIGSSVGVSRITVSRTLNELARSGLIKTAYGNIEILDCSGLRDAVSEN
jgi:CRP/FNR family transcriptional regulator